MNVSSDIVSFFIGFVLGFGGLFGLLAYAIRDTKSYNDQSLGIIDCLVAVDKDQKKSDGEKSDDII